MGTPSSDPPRPKPIRFRDLSKGWRLTLLAEWACLAWIPLSVILVWTSHQTGWPQPAVRSVTLHRAIEFMLQKSLIALVPATILHVAAQPRPRVRFPLGWSGTVLVCVWIVFLGCATTPVY
jgi:hypothetical protein